MSCGSYLPATSYLLMLLFCGGILKRTSSTINVGNAVESAARSSYSDVISMRAIIINRVFASER